MVKVIEDRKINGHEIWYRGTASMGYDDEYHWNGCYEGHVRRDNCHKTNHNYYFHIRSGTHKSFALYCTASYHSIRDITIDSGKVKTIKQAMQRIRNGIISFEDHSYLLDEWIAHHTHPVFIIENGEPEIIGVFHHSPSCEARALYEKKVNNYYYYHRGMPDYHKHKRIFTLKHHKWGPDIGKHYIGKEEFGIGWSSTGGATGIENNNEMIDKMLLKVAESKIPNLTVL